ncbi:MAG TPA: hypothetical protein VMZ03_06680 [Chitinophagaceae bacterium]|nr:hypothetical protein [Chitinophagaceae bacterium]
MKKFYFLLCLSFVVLNSRGQLLTEPFNYTPDPINGIAQQSGGVWVRINSGDSILVTAGNLSYTGLPASTGNKISFDGAGSDDYRAFTVQTAGAVYFSFILNVSSLGSLNTTGTYFTGLIQTASTSAFGGTVWTRLSSTPGRYNIGISTRSNSTVSWLAGDYVPGTSYFIVANYEIIAGTGNDVSKIWVNPALGGSEPAPDATAAAGTDFSATGIERILLRQDAATTTPFIDMDELRVGTTWTDVTPSAAVPALSISSPLAAFGSVCINTTAGPNSFTIAGINLTTANVTVAALPGFTYSTTSGGTYTTSLSLAQPGGTYSQQVFVKFNPTAVQSYNGNIAVGGGGAPSVNAAATGAGVNTLPSVTTGVATAITQTTATAAGTITSIGCSAITSNYGIEYSTTAGFANGSGTPVISTNLSGGNFTSALSGLTPTTTYYYHAFASNAAGTSYGAEQSFTTASPNPTINATSLTAFGNICINTTAGPNSFTISGANLTTANVTVAALPGFTYSTTAGGTYTTTLSLAQPGGTYSQQIFVKFTPTTVQSYNGNIAVAGGGVASPVNVAASGAGANSIASVTTGAASTITQTTATAAGTITAPGCSAISAYGIEYSLTNGFANGTGTQVASTNLAGGSFSAGLNGLTSNTIYYYKAYATNSGGTAYGTQQSFSTLPPVLSATALTPFGTTCINTTVGPNSFTITGVGLTNANVVVGPLAGYSFATTAGGTYTASLSLAQPGGAYSQTIFVKFNPALVQSYNGSIPLSGGGANATTVAAVGSGVNTLATVTTGAASNLTNHSALLAGSIGANGCSNVSVAGIEYSGINGFTNGTGTKVMASTIAGGNFLSSLTGLVQGATYYYKAYAINSGGISYGLQQSFTVPVISNGFTLSPNPVKRGAEVRVTMNGITPGYYGLLFINSAGALVYQYDMNIQANFINQTLAIPYGLPFGVYRVQLVDHLKKLATKTIMVQ